MGCRGAGRSGKSAASPRCGALVCAGEFARAFLWGVGGLRHDMPQNRTRAPLGACMTLDIGLLDFDGSKNRNQKMNVEFHGVLSLFIAQIAIGRHLCYNIFRRAKRGVGGALYLQSAAAGSNPRPEADVCEAGTDKEY